MPVFFCQLNQDTSLELCALPTQRGVACSSIWTCVSYTYIICISQFFPSTRYLDYAVRVEEYTLQKSSNLVSVAYFDSILKEFKK